MKTKFLCSILFSISILSCTQEKNSPYSYRLLGSEFVETTRPISPSDSIANVECIPISIQNNRYDSLVLYHDKAEILTQEGIEAFSTKQNDCGYVSIIDRFPDNQTTLLKNHSQTFYIEKTKQQEGCDYDSVLVWIASTRYSEKGTYTNPLEIRIE